MSEISATRTGRCSHEMTRIREAGHRTVSVVTLFAEYTDPRIVALYDTICPFSADTDFYLELAAAVDASTIVDVGCGTGVLACELTRRGHRVVGLDPSPAMLTIGRTRPGGERVRWIEGDADDLDVTGAELAIMSAHVAQVIVDDEPWFRTLAAIRRSLRPGGRVAFESRDPRTRSSAAGTIYSSPRRFHDPVVGAFDMWQDITEVTEDRVRYALRYRMADGSSLVSRNELRFRTHAGAVGRARGHRLRRRARLRRLGPEPGRPRHSRTDLRRRARLVRSREEQD